MKFLAIDPGPTESAWVEYEAVSAKIIDHGKRDNMYVLQVVLRPNPEYDLVIEKIASYGMPVGEEVFETVYWSGQFAHAYGGAHRITRLQIKLALCHDSRAKDANVRQALIDKWGGKAKAIGTKKAPGPLYGFAGDEWSALAVAVAWYRKIGGDT